MRNDGKVTVQPSNGRGKVTDGTTPTAATAVLVTGADYEELSSKIKAKYGFMVNVTRFLGKIGGIVKRKKQPYADTGVVITLS